LSKVGAEFDQTLVSWEPGLSHGPTSARFAVVDYDGDTGMLASPAEWKDGQFLDAGGTTVDKKLLKAAPDSPQAHQVHVWAVLQRALSITNTVVYTAVADKRIRNIWGKSAT
jgi:hypothetical protein